MRRISALLVLSLLVVAFMAMTASAAKAPHQTAKNPLLLKQGQYAFPDENNFSVNSSGITADQTQGLGSVASSAAPSPGVKIGDTWYDYQHNGRMPRMVDWGYSVADDLIIHFLWMYLPAPAFEERKYQYAAYLAQTGTFVAPTSIQPAGDYAGYVALDVTDANEAVAGGHNNQGAGYQSHTYWDFAPGWAFFGTGSRVPDSTSAYGTGLNWQVDSLKSVIWPDMVYQEVPTQTPVLHLFAQISEPNAADPQSIYYFRKEGIKEGGNFDHPPYVVDTVFDIAQSVAASNTSGKMALVWIANRPNDGDDDTASSNTGQQFVQWDNDIFYQISTDYGVTFSPRVNMTKNVDGEDGHRPYTDLAVLMDSNDDLHIAWNGRFWPADANTGGQAGLYRCRMFHWGENLGTGGYDGFGDAIIRTAANLEWDQDICTPGAWNVQGSKMSISECDGKLYYLYVQYNDIPNGINNDCAQRGIDGSDITGAANGELYIVVSDDGGLTWDQARNLTNSRTPGCDSATGVGGRCESDNWPSMARFGTDIVGTNMTGAEIVDPTGTYAGAHYLDIQFINDPDAGGIVQDEGTWQLADVKWFRMPCVEPVPVAILNITPTEVGFPNYTKHGVQADFDMLLENSGNTDCNGSIAVYETTGSAWLSTSFGVSYSVQSGQNNTATGTMSLNVGGTVNAPGTIVYLEGGIVFTGNQTTSPDTLPIEFWVADTVVAPIWDTISTSCLALIVGSNGNFGNAGEGGVNLDYFNTIDCDFVDDDVIDTVAGDASVYLYDGSPIVCWTDATDTVRCNYSMFNEGYLSEHGFFPMGHTPTADMGGYSVYQSEFVTRDTGLKIEKDWVAPDDSCWMVEVLKVYVVDGQTHTDLIIGEGMDWDIPSDSGSWNRSGFFPSIHAMYQQGSEITDSLGDALECLDNDTRFGGMRYMGARDKGTFEAASNFANAYTMDNSTQVYPEGFFPDDSLDKYMGGNLGFSTSDSVDADLHMVFTFRNGYTLTPVDTITIFKLFATVYSGTSSDLETRFANGYDWACENQYLLDAGLECGCCVNPGDINGDGSAVPDIADLVYLVAFMFSGGPAPTCMDQANVNGQPGPGVAPDIADLVYLVAYMFQGGPAPVCP